MPIESGAYAVEVLRGRIRDLQEPPNKPLTLQLKKGDSPLVDSGQLAGLDRPSGRSKVSITRAVSRFML